MLMQLLLLLWLLLVHGGGGVGGAGSGSTLAKASMIKPIQPVAVAAVPGRRRRGRDVTGHGAVGRALVAATHGSRGLGGLALVARHLLDEVQVVLLEVLVVEGAGLLAAVVPHEAPAMELACEGGVLGALEVLRQDLRHEVLRLEDGEGSAARHPRDDVLEIGVGQNFHELLVGLSMRCVALVAIGRICRFWLIDLSVRDDKR
mmetsp:Transcript_26295/g.73448  ORF Transcript_26295/g.73448 Transcript_26295/m.73448 type:complete len:203 (-) Transcript_26295:702-1310(-)